MRRRRRGFFFWVIVLALLVYALVYSNTKVVRTEYDVSSPDLPSAFSGTRVAVVADTHGRFDQEIVDICADADFIVLAGDIIDADSQKDDALAFAKKLVETGKPTYYVTGNHEWSTTVAETFKDALEARGVHVMDDKVLTYERGDASITISGRSDENVHGDRPSSEALLAGTQPEDFVLLISHRPYDYDEYAALGADLIVSGHIHGGLIRLPGLGGLIGPGHKFLPKLDGGTYPAVNGATLVVSRGLAGVKLNNTSFHWMRLFNPREVVMITLTKG